MKRTGSKLKTGSLRRKYNTGKKRSIRKRRKKRNGTTKRVMTGHSRKSTFGGHR
ncbi:hypothetical protein [Acinetobacter sp.]|uniref:hypothetical protein n=1 Tax=Acinetobacter sp. TaxID=472 RepID=UPI00118B5265|nr:hypothetical protein [Acinetobacter sp.]QDP47179.1 MAG: hypothetical protein GOVbin655_13 [Prokaryotic dsDNA virus sp.]|tara:strand:- start:4001 stop:4162 length:162 start_codon:yes stop_codon:yes gene_type:complete